MSTLNVPIAVGICVIAVCSFYYYMNKKMPSTHCKQMDQSRLKPNTSQQQSVTQKQDKMETLQEAEEQPNLEAFDDRYELKKIMKKDHNDTIEDHTNGVNEDNYMLYGCLDKNSHKTIATAVVTIIDGGFTGFILDLINSNHSRNDIATKLCEYAMDSTLQQYPSVQRFRSTKFNDKMTFETLDIARFIHHSSQSLFSEKLNQMNEDNKTNDVYNEYLSNFEEMNYRDIDNIICILSNYYQQTNIFIEWKVFDLNVNNHLYTKDECKDNEDIKDTSNQVKDKEDEDMLDDEYEIINKEDIDVEEDIYEEKENEDKEEDIVEENEEEEDIYTEQNKTNVGIQSIQYFKSYLFDEMSTHCIVVYGINTNDMDQEHGALCFQYRNTKLRPHSTLYHIFGNNEMGILSMVNKCYALWRNTIYDQDNMETIDFFLNSDVVDTNHQLRWLFAGGDTVYIRQKDTYDHLSIKEQ